MSRIEIVSNGITDLHTEAVVNAANEALQRGSGVCGAIFRAAGPVELARACDKIGHCDTGSAVITPAFALQDAKYIIHAVGPIWCGGAENEAELLRGAYLSSLELAAENGCSSIGFPLISTGVFGYPPEEAWTVALSACKSFIDSHPGLDILIRFGVPSEEKRSMGELEKCRMLPVLTSRKTAIGGGDQVNGIFRQPFPIYDDEVCRWIEAMYELDLMDRDYLSNIEKMKDRPIEKLGRDEVLTRMTWLIRGERFCDGLIAEWLENGLLEALCRRLYELTDQ